MREDVFPQVVDVVPTPESSMRVTPAEGIPEMRWWP
jgi:hypothetical protein